MQKFEGEEKAMMTLTPDGSLTCNGGGQGFGWRGIVQCAGGSHRFAADNEGEDFNILGAVLRTIRTSQWNTAFENLLRPAALINKRKNTIAFGMILALMLAAATAVPSDEAISDRNEKKRPGSFQLPGAEGFAVVATFASINHLWAVSPGA